MRSLLIDLDLNSSPEFASSIDGLIAQFGFNPQKLVIFRKTFTTKSDFIVFRDRIPAARSTGLDLSSTDTNRKVRNESILSLAGTVRDHDTPACGVGVRGGLEGLGNTSDLVDLEKERVAGFSLDRVFDTDGVGDREIVTDDLTIVSGAEVSPGLPVVLIEGILDTASKLSDFNGMYLTMGYSLARATYSSANCLELTHLLLSELGFLKSKSYLPSR